MVAVVGEGERVGAGTGGLQLWATGWGCEAGFRTCAHPPMDSWRGATDGMKI